MVGMLTVITYDVNTEDPAGRRRLRKVARHCVNYGQRVQNSVFECVADAATMVRIKSELVELIDPEKVCDSTVLETNMRRRLSM